MSCQWAAHREVLRRPVRGGHSRRWSRPGIAAPQRTSCRGSATGPAAGRARPPRSDARRSQARRRVGGRQWPYSDAAHARFPRGAPTTRHRARRRPRWSRIASLPARSRSARARHRTGDRRESRAGRERPLPTSGRSPPDLRQHGHGLAVDVEFTQSVAADVEGSLHGAMDVVLRAGIEGSGGDRPVVLDPDQHDAPVGVGERKSRVLQLLHRRAALELHVLALAREGGPTQGICLSSRPSELGLRTLA
jgi:hypothetical protein